MSIDYGPLRVRPKLSALAAREVRHDTPLRQARTCYGHLAGVAGVYLMDGMLAVGWLKEAETRPGDRHLRYVTTAAGDRALAVRGVERSSGNRAPPGEVYGCLDWTERHQHLGGKLGRTIVTSLWDGGFIRRSEGSREVAVLKPLSSWLQPDS